MLTLKDVAVCADSMQTGDAICLLLSADVGVLGAIPHEQDVVPCGTQCSFGLKAQGCRGLFLFGWQHFSVAEKPLLDLDKVGSQVSFVVVEPCGPRLFTTLSRSLASKSQELATPLMATKANRLTFLDAVRRGRTDQVVPRLRMYSTSREQVLFECCFRISCSEHGLTPRTWMRMSLIGPESPFAPQS